MPIRESAAGVKLSKTWYYPGFTPFVSKYSDNGLANTAVEVSAYMEQYRRRNPLAFLKHELGMKTTQRLRSYVLSDERLLKGVYRIYKVVKRSA